MWQCCFKFSCSFSHIPTAAYVKSNKLHIEGFTHLSQSHKMGNVETLFRLHSFSAALSVFHIRPHWKLAFFGEAGKASLCSHRGDCQKWTCHGKLLAWSWVQTALFLDGVRHWSPIWIKRWGIRKAYFQRQASKYPASTLSSGRTAPEVVFAVQGDEPVQTVRYQRHWTFSHAFKWERSLS